MFETISFGRTFWLPLGAAFAWMICGQQAGAFGLLYATLPVLLFSVASYYGLRPVDADRSVKYAALGGAIGALLAVLSIFLLGFFEGLALLGASAWSFVDAGERATRALEPVEDVPAPEPGLRFHAAVALDEAILGMMLTTVALPGKGEPARIAREVDQAIELFEGHGWLEKPAEYHRAPLPLELPRIESRSTRTLAGRIGYEEMFFESEYEPAPGEPGRERWLDYLPNRTASAHVMRHAGGPRPWLVCIHGYQMGAPWIDLGAFEAPYLHEKLGYNLVFPTLPLHGSRKIGRLSGDGFMSGDVLDHIHAEAQGLWDIRRILSWVRAQEAPSIGVYGLSLGGYTTSMLVGVEEGLDFAIAGIPMTDAAAQFWTHMPDRLVRDYLESGLTREKLDVVTRVVNPTLLEPRVPVERRAIFGGVGDRLVPAEQVASLVRHWKASNAVWYMGSHLTFARVPAVRRLIADTLSRVSAGAGPTDTQETSG